MRKWDSDRILVLVVINYFLPLTPALGMGMEWSDDDDDIYACGGRRRRGECVYL